MSAFCELSQPEQLDRLWQLAGETNGMDAVERALLELEPDDRTWRVAEFAIRLKDASRYEQGIAILRRCFDPSNEHHHYQLGLCLSYAQKQLEARQSLEQAFAMSGGGNPLVANDHILNLAQLGEIDQANSAVQHLRSVGVVSVEECDRLSAMVNLLAMFPPSQILRQLDEALVDREWWSIDRLLMQLKVFLKYGEGFAFFRLDDGEGSNLPWSDEILSGSSALLDFNRDIFLSHWFGQHGVQPALAAGWQEIQSQLGEVSQRVDLIGLNAPQRLRHELAVNSSRGIPAILNTYRWTLLNESSCSGQAICHAQMHFELGLSSDRFFEVIRSAHSLHLISSRRQFLEVMQRVAPSLNIHLIEIPGERLRVSHGGDTSVQPDASSHFPVRFHEVLDEISASVVPGSLWLIGAGFLAKLYCMRIRDLGGVALDLGSLIDLYSGVNSRGFPDSLVHRINEHLSREVA